MGTRGICALGKQKKVKPFEGLTEPRLESPREGETGRPVTHPCFPALLHAIQICAQKYKLVHLQVVNTMDPKGEHIHHGVLVYY
jgi:hypothetical protein